MAVNEGGAAFPVNTGASTKVGAACPDPGMSLRDWFAGQALAGLSQRDMSESYKGDSFSYLNAIALAAYRTADAMLAQRAKDVDA